MSHLMLVVYLVIAFSISSAQAESTKEKCRSIYAAMDKLPDYWTAFSIGEDPDEEARIYRTPVESYFVGDKIGIIIYVFSACDKPGVTKEDLVSATSCMSLEVWPVKNSDKGIDIQSELSPLFCGRIPQLLVDNDSHKNDKYMNNRHFITNIGHKEGLYMRPFTLDEAINTDLPVGIYRLQLVANDKECGLMLPPKLGYRTIRIVEPNTPKYMAVKKSRTLCGQAREILRRKENIIEAYEEVIRKMILPELENIPKSLCALNLLVEYYGKVGNRSEYEKYHSKMCNALGNEKIRASCIRGMKTKLENWDNPKWR